MPANAPAGDGSEEREALGEILRQRMHNVVIDNDLTPWWLMGADAVLAAGFTRADHRDGERADAYGNACKLVADMHAAAVGSVRGPIVGVVQDVAALRAERDALAAKLAEAVKARDSMEIGLVRREAEHVQSFLRAEAAEKRAAALAEPCTAAINALMALGSLIQNDSGTWKIRRHDQDMQAIVNAINRTVPIARAALAGNGNGTGEGA